MITRQFYGTEKLKASASVSTSRVIVFEPSKASFSRVSRRLWTDVGNGVSDRFSHCDRVQNAAAEKDLITSNIVVVCNDRSKFRDAMARKGVEGYPKGLNRYK
jgi:hypothetical protein